MKNPLGILTGIALNLCIALGSVIIFNIINSSSLSFHLFVLSSISFFNVL